MCVYVCVFRDWEELCDICLRVAGYFRESRFLNKSIVGMKWEQAPSLSDGLSASLVEALKHVSESLC